MRRRLHSVLLCYAAVAYTAVEGLICQPYQVEPLMQILESHVAIECRSEMSRQSIREIKLACAVIPECAEKYERIEKKMPDCGYIVDGDGKNMGARLESEMKECSSSSASIVHVLLLPFPFLLLLLVPVILFNT